MTIKKGETILAPIFQNIPKELKCSPHWLLWKARPSDGKKDELTKFPVNIEGKGFSWNNPNNLYTFEEVEKAFQTGKFDGIGFGLKGTDFICIDLDNVTFGNQSDELHKVMGDGYMESSPSKKGYYIWIKGKKPAGMGKIGYTAAGEKLEVFGDNGWVTVTGDAFWLWSASIEENQNLINTLYLSCFKEKHNDINNNVNPMQPITIPDFQTIIKTLFNSSDGLKIQALWNGDTSGYGWDHSRADFALCRFLAFYANEDYSTVDAMFRQSGLMRPKWDRRWGESTYGRKTIEKAIDSVEGYRVVDRFELGGFEVGTEGFQKEIEEQQHDFQSVFLRSNEDIMSTLLKHFKMQDEVNRTLLQRLEHLESFNTVLLQRIERQESYNLTILQRLNQQQTLNSELAYQMEQVQTFNRELVQRLEQQQKYNEKYLEQHEQKLMESLSEPILQLLHIASSQQEKKKGILPRLLRK